MALLSTQVLSSITGNAVTLSAVNSSDTITPDSSKTMILVVVNGGGSSDTVTIAITSGSDPWGRAYAAQTVTVANGTTKYIYLQNPAVLADVTTGLITVTHSFVTSVTGAVIACAK